MFDYRFSPYKSVLFSIAYLSDMSIVMERRLMSKYPVARMYDGIGTDVSASEIIQSSRPKAAR